MPHAQAVRQAQTHHQSQKVITFNQSYQCVKTMMEASIGCITFLRGLLPDDNFEDDGINPMAKPGSSVSAQGSTSGGSLKIKKIKRNYSPEGDKLLDYLEKGVFDAVERKFLRSMVLSIYLDPDDPSNVIETYTFNFSYHDVEGVGSVPMLSVEQSMKSMNVADDPILAATTAGQALTLGTVKKSVKALIKNLILMTQNLVELPRKRCISIKLFYQPDAPEDYEPPMFRRADPETEKLYFGTHSREEAPEITNIGKMETGHHGVQIKIRSVAEYLPRSHDAEDLETPYGEEPSKEHGVDPEDGRAMDLENQAQDQIARNILWNAEDQVDEDRSDMEDADAEADLDISPRSVLPQPIYNAAFAERVGSKEYRAFPAAEILDEAEQRRRTLAGKGKQREVVNEEPPCSQEVSRVMAKPKRGEGDGGHAMKDSGNKIKLLTGPKLTPDGSGHMEETQPIAGPSSSVPGGGGGGISRDVESVAISIPEEDPSSMQLDVDVEEPSFADIGPHSNDEDGTLPRSMSVTSMRPKKVREEEKTQMDDEIEPQTQIQPTHPLLPRRTSARLHPPAAQSQPQDDEHDPIISFSQESQTQSQSHSHSMDVDGQPLPSTYTKKKPVAATRGRKPNAQRRVDESDIDEEATQSQIQSQCRTRGEGAGTKKKATTTNTTNAASKASGSRGRGSSVSRGGSYKRAGVGRGSGGGGGETSGGGTGGKAKSKKTKKKEEVTEASVKRKGSEGEGGGQVGGGCWCGDKDADGPEVSCDGCERWVHMFCHGASKENEVKDQVEPWYCADCELRRDPRTNHWLEPRFETAIQNFRTLALFRRSLRVVFDEPMVANVKELSDRLACPIADAQKVLIRLEDEGFVKRVKDKAVSVLDSKQTKRRGYEAVKNEGTRQAMKLYFDRSNRKLEDKVFGLETERIEEMDLDEDYPHAQPLPGRDSHPTSTPSRLLTNNNAQPSSSSSHLSKALSSSSAHNHNQQLGTSSTAKPSTSASASRSASIDESQTQPEDDEQNESSQLSASGSKRKLNDDGSGSDENGKTLGDAFGVVTTGAAKRMRASVASQGVDLTY
ncbi:HORMA domain-containing protein [Mrakia frigida]|uniref:Hop1p n=1 Tax=Mrakia frigida TaxID=29902 RepID=UPI003FCC04BD